MRMKMLHFRRVFSFFCPIFCVSKLEYIYIIFFVPSNWPKEKKNVGASKFAETVYVYSIRRYKLCVYKNIEHVVYNKVLQSSILIFIITQFDHLIKTKKQKIMLVNKNENKK